ncbi:MAG TPA: S9 family peptidase [Terriglobales bacterium]|nr:S9 family peptidase [Terriglobales bacterium]
MTVELGFLLLAVAMTITDSASTDSARADSAAAAQPPVAGRVPRTETVHGDARLDNYFWLRDKQNPEVKTYLDAENAYTDALMTPTQALQQTLYQEMVGHIKETDMGVPYRDGAWFYYSRTEQGKQYPIYCRKRGSLEAAEQIFLDVNQLAVGEKFMSVGAWQVSDDGNLLAYITDNTGFRQYTLHLKNLATGELYPERVERVGSLAWAADNKTLFYTVEEDKTKRQYRLYRHPLGQDPARDVLIYEDPDERFNLNVERTRSRTFLLLESGSHTTSEWRYLRADQPAAEWQLIAPRLQDREYEVAHHGDEFYIRVNDTGRNFRLVTAPVAHPGSENWKELVPHRPNIMLTGMEMFDGFYVRLEREDGLPHFRVVDFKSGQTTSVAFPEPAYAASPAQNREYQTTRFRYGYQSMVTPSSVYDYDVVSHASTLLKRFEVPGYDPAAYRAERIYATAGDGTRVPISLVYRRGFAADGAHPMLLTAYGAYGFTLPVNFNANVLSLLDRGFVYAMAHVRGGGDMGKAWHDQGRMMNKKNTFTDFIACAEYLVARNYTSPQRLIISGTSAGGLLIGAVVNLRPDLFHAAVLRVPFVDVINTMLDESLPLTVPEFEEWGNPKVKADYDYMLSYSPYDQLARKPYPAILVKTSFNDSQVMYWEPAKYVARLRTLKTDSHPLLLKTNMAAGHGGASGRYDLLHETAFEYAFMLWQAGITR